MSFWTIIEQKDTVVRNVSIFIVWLFIVSALIGVALGYRDWFIPKTPINLLVGATLLVINLRINHLGAYAAFALAFAVGMGIEMLGVATGKIFGVYNYGGHLGAKLAHVPYMIGLYWAVLTLASSMIARYYTSGPLVTAVIGATIMVMLDYLMEQRSCALDFWCFANDHAPFQNYVAWWLTAFVLHLATLRLLPEQKGRLYSAHLLLSQGTFFVVIYWLIKA